MDTCSSGEDLLIKTRKPYTITKQRERWTEEEHNRFLEALKLYGRAWQRIEEHIGTKTAVQIRSHAQKFFSKLEKEALVKGVPIGQAIDIEIPPPRPKRKPNNPYPRKTGATSSPSTQIRVKDGKQLLSGSSRTSDQVLDLEKEPLPEKPADDDGNHNIKEKCNDDKISETLTLFEKAHSTVAASTNENSTITTEPSRKSCNFEDPMQMREQINEAAASDFCPVNGTKRNHKASEPDTGETPENYTENEMHAAKNFPRHAPVQVLDGNSGACNHNLSSDVSHQESTFYRMGIPSRPALFSNASTSAAVESQHSSSRSNNHQMFQSFQPPFPNTQEDYSTYLQMSSTFSSLIVSALLQNPAAHAAATFAASFWPHPNIEIPANCTNGGFPQRSMNTTSSMAAIAAATVAAATAWWAAHGLLPLCAPPLHGGGFGCPSVPTTNVAQTQAPVEEKVENNFQNHPDSQEVQNPDQDISEALQPQNSASKSSATSTSNSGNSLETKMKTDLPVVNNNDENVPAMMDQKESNKGKIKKQVDRSSCGSNTPSGSDVETDAMEKNDKTNNEETKEPDVDHLAGDPSNRRYRITGNLNDSWKEVSEGGRLAFQALFSRQVLPQSFSPPHNVSSVNKDMNVGIGEIRQIPTKNNNVVDASQLDLNSNTRESCSDQGQGLLKNGGSIDENRMDGLLTIGLEGKLKNRRTGFKPYKRCSVEAMESRVNPGTQDQEKCPKRLRLEGEASI